VSIADLILGTAPDTKAGGRSATRVGNGDPFAEANDLEPRDVLDWLGVELDGDKLRSCPACGADGADTSVMIVRGGWKCMHESCAGRGHPSKPGFRTNVDSVMELRETDKRGAIELLADRFGVSKLTPVRNPESEARRRDDAEWQPDESCPEAQRYYATQAEGAPPQEHESDKAPVRDDTKASPKSVGFSVQLLSIEDLLTQVVIELQKPKKQPGVSTGNSELDLAIGGFRPGNVTVFGAKRGFGKSSYGNLVTVRAISEGYRVLLIAGEDPAIMYGKRLMAMLTGVNAMMLRDGSCRPTDWPRITEAVCQASKVPFFWRTDGAPVETIARVIREVGKRERLDLVVADYLQCIRASKNGLDRRNEVTYTMRMLCDASRASNAAMLLFSQLKRSEREEPEIEDLKESGDIEDMADHVLLGWKKETSQAGQQAIQRWIKVGKNKDGLDPGEMSALVQRWNTHTASFEFTGRPTSDTAPDEYTDWNDV
jgi:hypothetical protein